MLLDHEKSACIDALMIMYSLKVNKDVIIEAMMQINGINQQINKWHNVLNKLAHLTQKFSHFFFFLPCLYRKKKKNSRYVMMRVIINWLFKIKQKWVTYSAADRCCLYFSDEKYCGLLPEWSRKRLVWELYYSDKMWQTHKFPWNK